MGQHSTDVERVVDACEPTTGVALLNELMRRLGSLESLQWGVQPPRPPVWVARPARQDPASHAEKGGPPSSMDEYRWSTFGQLDLAGALMSLAALLTVPPCRKMASVTAGKSKPAAKRVRSSGPARALATSGETWSSSLAIPSAHEPFAAES